MADELMVEEKSRLSILLIEDNAGFAANAEVALKGHDVTWAPSLHEAMNKIFRGKFDVIISDVHVPVHEGKEPVAIVSEVLAMCLGSGSPVCFVTRADHHGMLDLGDEGYVSLKATTRGRVLQTHMETAKARPSNTELFRKLKTTESENIKSGTKTPEIWGRALEMARNAMAKPTAIGRAARQVGKLGLDVRIENGMPKVIPRK